MLPPQEAISGAHCTGQFSSIIFASPFWKVVEKIVVQQFQRTLYEENYLDSFQSRLRPKNEMEMAFVMFLDDL